MQNRISYPNELPVKVYDVFPSCISALLRVVTGVGVGVLVGLGVGVLVGIDDGVATDGLKSAVAMGYFA